MTSLIVNRGTTIVTNKPDMEHMTMKQQPKFTNSQILYHLHPFQKG